MKRLRRLSRFLPKRPAKPAAGHQNPWWHGARRTSFAVGRRILPGWACEFDSASGRGDRPAAGRKATAGHWSMPGTCPPNARRISPRPRRSPQGAPVSTSPSAASLTLPPAGHASTPSASLRVLGQERARPHRQGARQRPWPADRAAPPSLQSPVNRQAKYPIWPPCRRSALRPPSACSAATAGFTINPGEQDGWICAVVRPGQESKTPSSADGLQRRRGPLPHVSIGRIKTVTDEGLSPCQATEGPVSVFPGHRIAASVHALASQYVTPGGLDGSWPLPGP
jgi:hypothetical protein